MDIISAVASVNAIIIALLLINKKGKNVSNKILIAWTFNFALHFSILFLASRAILLQPVNWGFILGIVLVAHTPFLFLYTKSLTQRNFKPDFKNLSYFGFVLIYIATFIPNLMLSQEARMELVYNKQNMDYHTFVPMITLLFCQVYFLIRTIILLINHQHRIKSEFSYEESINLAWIKHIVYGFAFIIVISFIAYGLVSAQIISIYQMDSSIIVVNMVLFFYIAYRGYNQRTVYLTKEKPESGQTQIQAGENIDVPKESDADANLSEKDPRMEELISLMKKEKLYLDPELNVGDLANKLGIHSHQLSKMVNSQLNRNFFEFINEYRVEEFKKLATDPKNKHISILGLAMDAGFNSKATFNRIFKSTTGLTPSDFRAGFKF
ncbi:helix-turn-helix domain-containing protein [Maribellus sediminis]|uniref:helix-turn-helix domain-containing protein n=1 Tax=Maribellus sediminis TaxID=2696285 RepID=UPI0014312907|nr:helix-turn-helix domain-containing protein [Maribellus sediminis]